MHLLPAVFPRPHPAWRGAQRGIATVLTVMLIGLALSATVLGTMYYLRGAQEQSTSLHAQTQAQMKAWTGAEILRQYLLQLQTDGRLAQLVTAVNAAQDTTLVLTGAGVTDTISARFVPPASATQFTAMVTGVTAAGSRAQASSTLRVVYKVGGGSTPAVKPPSVLTFNRGLKLSGSIAVKTDPSTTTAYEINVLGDVSTGGNSITGVRKINALGSINIGSGSSFDELNANCDVSISGSVTATRINAMRNVCASGGASVPGTVKANGSVRMESGYSANGAIVAIANATDVAACEPSGNNPAWNSNVAATCAAPRFAGVDLSAGGAGSKSVTTKGSVEISAGQIGTLDAEGNLSVASGAVTGSIGGKVSKPSWNGQVQVTEIPGKIVTITPVPKLTMVTETFNANALEASANYAFKVDSQGYKKVTVRNVQGLADGVYYLGNYNGPYKDYLCTALANGSSPNSPNCLTPAATASKTICQGYSEYNNCFTYNNGSWTINGKSMAPGVAWFQGNLEVSNGVYYNTFIATGNIVTSGSHQTFAPSFAGYDGTSAGVRYAPTGICANSNFPALVPLQLCDTTQKKYLSAGNESIANFAFMAGSRANDNYADTAGYVGGNITLGASSVVHGSIKAGNEFTSGGSSTIQGYVSALGLGVKILNAMGGNTTFDLQQLPASFDPGGGTGGDGSPGGSPGGGTAASVQILWARYQ